MPAPMTTTSAVRSSARGEYLMSSAFWFQGLSGDNPGTCRDAWARNGWSGRRRRQAVSGRGQGGCAPYPSPRPGGPRPAFRAAHRVLPFAGLVGGMRLAAEAASRGPGGDGGHGAHASGT